MTTNNNQMHGVFQNETMRKLKIEIMIIVVLMVCLCVTTVALALSQTTTKNTFQTDAIDIVLNNGRKIIDEDDQSISPGKTIVTKFPLKNNSNHDIFYRLYFANIKDGEGNLADILEVTIRRIDTNVVLCEGYMPEIVKSTAEPISDPILANQQIMLEAVFYLPESAKDNLQSEGVTFDLVVEAVQAENNEEMDFGDETDPIDPDDIIINLDTSDIDGDGDSVDPDETQLTPDSTTSDETANPTDTNIDIDGSPDTDTAE